MSKKQASNSIICTLAVGEKYVNSFLRLISDLDGSGNNFLVVTDRPERFPSSVIAVPFVDDTTHICQQKRFAVIEALKHFNTAFFLDADYKANHKSPYYKAAYGDIESFPQIDIDLAKGLHSCIPKTKTKLLKQVRPSISPVLDGLCDLLSIDIENVVDVSCYSWFFSLDSSKKYLDFFTVWGKIALWLKEKGYLIPDGIVMSFAAAKVGIDVYGGENTLPWDLFRGSLVHDCIGDWHKNNFEGWT